MSLPTDHRPSGLPCRISSGREIRRRSTKRSVTTRGRQAKTTKIPVMERITTDARTVNYWLKTAKARRQQTLEMDPPSHRVRLSSSTRRRSLSCVTTMSTSRMVPAKLAITTTETSKTIPLTLRSQEMSHRLVTPPLTKTWSTLAYSPCLRPSQRSLCLSARSADAQRRRSLRSRSLIMNSLTCRRVSAKRRKSRRVLTLTEAFMRKACVRTVTTRLVGPSQRSAVRTRTCTLRTSAKTAT